MVSREFLRERLYSAYASQHAATGGGEAVALNYQRDIRPAQPAPSAGPNLDIGCDQDPLAHLMCTDDCDLEGIDISSDQGAIARAARLRGHIVTKNLTFIARKGH